MAGTRFTYTVGRLALLARDTSVFGNETIAGDVLKRGAFRRLAIANPDLAPYGLAAEQTLDALGLADIVADRIVRGENVGQAVAFVATGNAELGLVAQTQVPDGAAALLVPDDLHAPIAQDAILLADGPDPVAAAAFLALLDSARGRDIAASLPDSAGD